MYLDIIIELEFYYINVKITLTKVVYFVLISELLGSEQYKGQ